MTFGSFSIHLLLRVAYSLAAFSAIGWIVLIAINFIPRNDHK
jgi:hypothetical protein